MQVNSKEHDEMMKQFEKDHGYSGYEKEDRSWWNKAIFYQNGEINKLFLMYKSGYSFGRCVYLNQ